MKMLVRLGVVACVLGEVCGAQSGSAKRPMTFADLQAMKRVSDPQISPSGKWVMFSVTDVSLERNSKTNHLWVVALGGSRAQGPGSSERQVTEGPGESSGRFSPDGKWVMYSADDQLQVAAWDDDAGKIGKGHAVTSLETGADGGVWAPDSKHFLFVSNVYPECESHAAMGPQRNEEEVACNARKDVEAAKNPVKALIFDHLLYRHWTAFQGAKHSHIFYASVDKGAPTDLTPGSVVGDHEAPTFSLGGPMGYAISPDGKEVAYVTNLDKVPAASTNNDIFVVEVGAEPNTAKKVSTSPGSDDGPAYSPDGKWLAWRSQKRNGFESDKFELVALDRQSGKIWPLTSNFDGWVDEFVWDCDSSGIFFASAQKGQELIFSKSMLKRMDDDVSPIDGTPGAKVLSGEYSSLVAVPGNATSLIATRMTVNSPAEIVSVDAFSIPGGAHSITHLNDSMNAHLQLSPLEPFWFTGAAGTKVEGFIVKPPNFDPAKKYPVKFLMHGGPQTAWGDAWSYRWNPELFAADGYVVVMVNRRGSTGYGQKFVDEVSGDWGGKAYVDLMKGLDYAETHYSFIDKDRECALGASYGGFMANWVLTHTDRFKCVVTHDGMYNPQSAYGTTEELWFNEWEFRPVVAVAKTQIPYGDDNKKSDNKKGGNKKGDEKKSENGMVEQTKPAQPWDYFGATNENDPFRKWSPMLHIKNAHTPTLIIHSQKDYRLDVSEGFQMFTALQRLGVPSRMLYFPDEGHWVLKPQNSRLWYETVNDWCDRWTGMGKYKGTGPRAQGPAIEPAKSGK